MPLSDALPFVRIPVKQDISTLLSLFLSNSEGALARGIASNFLSGRLAQACKYLRKPFAQFQQAFISGMRLESDRQSAQLIFLNRLMRAFAESLVSLRVILTQLNQILIMRTG